MTKGKKNNEKISYYISVRIINYIVEHVFKNVHSVNSFTTSPFQPPTYFHDLFIFFNFPSMHWFYRKT